MPESLPAIDRAATALTRLLRIMERLRGPGGCEWDAAQDLRSLRAYLIEETYEVLDALDQGDLGELRAELGDLLFQIVFQARLAEESGAFAMAEVIEGIADKLTSRHPHLFGEPGGLTASSSRSETDWAELKRRERMAKGAGHPSALDGIPTQAPALVRAERMGEKAAHEGFDWPSVAGVEDKLREELTELSEAMIGGDRHRIQAELGDVLFTLGNLARWLKTPAEDALREATTRFETRFRFVEAALAKHGQRIAEVDPSETDRLWAVAKQAVKTCQPIDPSGPDQRGGARARPVPTK